MDMSHNISRECADPSGARGGLWDPAHTSGPPQSCLQAMGIGETSRSQGTRGPIPGYLMRGPPSRTTSVGLVAPGSTHETRQPSSTGWQLPQLNSSLSHTETEHDSISQAHQSRRRRANNRDTDTTNSTSSLPPAVSQNTSTISTCLRRGPNQRRRTPILLEDAPLRLKNLRLAQHNTLGAPTNPGKQTRAHIKIGSINIKGRGASHIYDQGHKWNDIFRVMTTAKYAIMGVHESHLSPEQTEEINSSYVGQKIKVFSTIDEGAPNAAGTALALNSNLIHTDPTRVTTLIRGRALLVECCWKDNKSLAILSLYAPNDTMANNRKFWKELTKQYLEFNIPVPDIILTDSNIVEEAMDRSNIRPDLLSAVEAFHDFKTILRMRDSTLTASRIDRIYVCEDILPFCYEWSILDDFGGISDHRLVSVTLNSPELPSPGDGRYSIHQTSVDNKLFMTKLMESSYARLHSIITFEETARSNTYNVQVLYRDWKEWVVSEERTFRKKNIGMVKTLIRQKQNKRGRLHNLPRRQRTTESEQEALTLQLEINELQQKLAKNQKEQNRLNIELKDGLVTKSSVKRMGIKDERMKDLILTLKETDPTTGRAR
ncbi:hypothetical protein PQX77_009256, partial [Marasmius sp. AFHP31]